MLAGEEIALGPGKVDLLEQIHAQGSILKAARKMNMSYMRAWTLLKTMENCFKRELVIKSRGGKRGGSAKLTEAGRTLLSLYRQMERDCRKATAPAWRRVKVLLKARGKLN